MLKSIGKYRDYAPVTLRVMLGTTLLFSHGLPKLLSPNRWEREGQAMATFGITFAPVFWGFMSGFTETLAGICFWLGLAVRPMAIVMLWVMFVAASRSVAMGAGLRGGNAHPVDFAAGALALLLLGAGKWSLDKKLGWWDEGPKEEQLTPPRRVAV
jgi:putative oxidoreductase